MLIKRLSKIGLTLLLAVSFIVPSTFPARAEFSSTDSHNIDLIEENTANTYSRLGTTNTRLSEISTKLTNVYNDVGSIKNAVTNTISTTINTISTTLTSIKGYVDGLEGYVDGVETKLDSVIGALGTSNGNWVTLGNYIDAMYQIMQTQDSTSTDIYNLLNTYTNTYLVSIDKTLAVISDNIVVDRWGSQQNTITVTSPASNTYTYTLATVQFPTITISTSASGVPTLVQTNVTRYGNFHGILRALGNELFQQIFVKGYNALLGLQYIISTDTEYIGTEAHLIYQLLDSFKSANHTDITNFASANHTDITTFNSAFNTWVNKWIPWAKQYYIIKDHLTNTRRSDTQDTITLNTFDGNISYQLGQIDIYSIYYNSENKTFGRETLTRYANFRGSIFVQLTTLNNALWAYYQYVSDKSVANSIANNVNALDQNLTTLENAESQVTTSAIQRINNFLPDPNSIGALSALSWGSNFLQRIFVALGAFNIPILCALVLSVCMQFIGYFKYKT